MIPRTAAALLLTSGPGPAPTCAKKEGGSR